MGGCGYSKLNNRTKISSFDTTSMITGNLQQGLFYQNEILIYLSVEFHQQKIVRKIHLKQNINIISYLKEFRNQIQIFFGIQLQNIKIYHQNRILIENQFNDIVLDPFFIIFKLNEEQIIKNFNYFKNIQFQGQWLNLQKTIEKFLQINQDNYHEFVLSLLNTLEDQLVKPKLNRTKTILPENLNSSSFKKSKSVDQQMPINNLINFNDRQIISYKKDPKIVQDAYLPIFNQNHSLKQFCNIIQSKSYSDSIKYDQTIMYRFYKQMKSLEQAIIQFIKIQSLVFEDEKFLNLAQKYQSQTQFTQTYNLFKQKFDTQEINFEHKLYHQVVANCLKQVIDLETKSEQIMNEFLEMSIEGIYGIIHKKLMPCMSTLNIQFSGFLHYEHKQIEIIKISDDSGQLYKKYKQECKIVNELMNDRLLENCLAPMINIIKYQRYLFICQLKTPCSWEDQVFGSFHQDMKFGVNQTPQLFQVLKKMFSFPIFRNCPEQQNSINLKVCKGNFVWVDLRSLNNQNEQINIRQVKFVEKNNQNVQINEINEIAQRNIQRCNSQQYQANDFISDKEKNKKIIQRQQTCQTNNIQPFQEYLNNNEDFTKINENQDLPQNNENYPKNNQNQDFPKNNVNFPKNNENFPKNNENFSKNNENFLKNNENFPKNNENFSKKNENFPKDNENFSKNNENQDFKNSRLNLQNVESNEVLSNSSYNIKQIDNSIQNISQDFNQEQLNTILPQENNFKQQILLDQHINEYIDEVYGKLMFEDIKFDNYVSNQQEQTEISQDFEQNEIVLEGNIRNNIILQQFQSEDENNSLLIEIPQDQPNKIYHDQKKNFLKLEYSQNISQYQLQSQSFVQDNYYKLNEKFNISPLQIQLNKQNSVVNSQVIVPNLVKQESQVIILFLYQQQQANIQIINQINLIHIIIIIVKLQQQIHNFYFLQLYLGLINSESK